MSRKLLTLGIGALMLALVAPVYAQSAQWIHVRVDETDSAKVNVNLPVSLLEVAMEIAEEHGADMMEEHGGMHFGRHGHMEVADLRRMWNELRESGDAEYVNVEDGDENVRIYRQGDSVHIQVDDEGDEKVRMEVPFSVVDTLLEGEGNELNLSGALRKLADSNNGQIIQVTDDDTTVRVWIDDKNEG